MECKPLPVGYKWVKQTCSDGSLFPSPVPIDTTTGREIQINNGLFISERELLKRPTRTHLIADFLGRGELTIAWGPYKLGGKTAFWLRVARRVSQGLPVFGHAVNEVPHSGRGKLHLVPKSPPRPPKHRTLYIALENPADVRDRVEALIKVDGPAPNFRLVVEPVDLLDEVMVFRLCRFIESENVVLVVVDTLARALGGADENRGAEVAVLFRNLAKLRRTGAVVVLIHHGAKSGAASPRGHGDLGAAPDTLIEHVHQKDGTRIAKVVAARADPPGLTLSYQVAPFTLSDPHRTTVVAEELTEKRGRARGHYAEIALDRLRHAVAAAGGAPVPVDPTWRAAFYEALPTLSAENRRKQFTRAKAELLAEAQVTMTDGAACPS